MTVTTLKKLRRKFINNQLPKDLFQRLVAQANIDLTNVEWMFTKACPWTIIKPEVKSVLVDTMIANAA